MTDSSPDEHIYSVSQLNRQTALLLEQEFPRIWVEGEISNLAMPSSGHIYFTLKDTSAQVRCAMFKSRNRHIKQTPRNGSQVLLRVQVALYEARGEYQLIVDHMELAGDGLLRQRFDRLKNQLSEEGLFAEINKQLLPPLPKRIGVITSPTGAAIKDIISVLQRRFPTIPILIYPVAVQGEGASAQITRMIKHANQHKLCDVLLLSRGGGSLEDLWAFNEEAVARAIFDSKLPIVTGVGHEIDFTIADFVADQRAATPSAAAELLSPHQDEYWENLLQYQQRFHSIIKQQLRYHQQRLENAQKRLRHPRQQLMSQAQKLDDMEQRLIFVYKSLLQQRQSQLRLIINQLQHHSPQRQLKEQLLRINTLKQRLYSAMTQRFQYFQQQFTATARALDAISPLETLSRGYAIVKQLPQDKVVHAASKLSVGDRVSAQFSNDQAICEVLETKNIALETSVKTTKLP